MGSPAYMFVKSLSDKCLFHKLDQTKKAYVESYPFNTWKREESREEGQENERRDEKDDLVR